MKTNLKRYVLVKKDEKNYIIDTTKNPAGFDDDYLSNYYIIESTMEVHADIKFTSALIENVNCPPEMKNIVSSICLGKFIATSDNKEELEAKLIELSKINSKKLLTQEEKDWLENFLKPFKVNILALIIREELFDYLYLSVVYFSTRSGFKIKDIPLPEFRKGSKYKNLEVDIPYSLEDLGLFQDKENKK